VRGERDGRGGARPPRKKWPRIAPV